MKANFLKSHNNKANISLMGYDSFKNKRENKNYADNNKTNLNIRENTSKIQLNRPAQANSFSGSVISSSNNSSNGHGAQSISFGASVAGVAQGWANKAIQSGGLNKVVKFVQDNEVLVSSSIALGLAGIIKPGLVLVQTGFDDPDGQIIATKNSTQAFVGFGLNVTAGAMFVKKCFDGMINNLDMLIPHKDDKGNISFSVRDFSDKKVQDIAQKVLKKENAFKYSYENEKGFWKKVRIFLEDDKASSSYQPTKEEINAKAQYLVENLKTKHLPIFEKNKKFVYKLVENRRQLELNPVTLRQATKNCRSQVSDSFESFWKNSTGVITTIGKAKISSMLLPILLTTLFTSYKIEKQAKSDKQSSQADSNLTLTTSKTFQEKKAKYDRIMNPDKSSSKLSFKGGAFDKFIDSSTQFFENLAVSKGGEMCVEGLSKHSKKPSARMGDIESVGLTIYWVVNTLLSKAIEKGQKFGLIAHTILVTVISSIAALLSDISTDPIVDKLKDTYGQKITEIIEEFKKKTPKVNANKDNIKEALEAGCSKLYKSKDIVDKLSDKDLLYNETQLKQAIEGLSYKYSKDLSKAKSVIIFTAVVRFLVPVTTVKLSKKLKKWLIEFSKKWDEKKKEKELQETNSQPKATVA